MHRGVVLGFLACLVTTTASAQDTMLTVRGMAVSSDPATRGSIGAGSVIELSRRFAVATELDYVQIADWSSTTTSTATLVMALSREGWFSWRVPYVFGGGGVQRARISLGSARVLGAVPDDVQAGAQFCAAAGSGIGPDAGPIVSTDRGCTGGQLTGWGVGDLPVFYARRLGVLIVPFERRWHDEVFFDPVVTLGGGVRLRASDHWIISPEARVWIAFADGERRVSGVFGATFGYRF